MKYDRIISKTSKPHLFGIIGKGSYSTGPVDGSGAVRSEKGEQVSIDEVKAKKDRILSAAVNMVLTQRLA
jgi:hypothetical protein